MRYIKLNISLLIGFIGLVIYFLTIPTIDAENFMSIDVESGDKEVFNHLYLGGSIDYNNNYSSFVYQNKQLSITEELPTLKKLDEPNLPKEQKLLNQYPKFTSKINYDTNIIDSHFLDSEDYVISSFFNVAEKNYSTDLKKLNLRILNKTTDKIEEDEIPREENIKGDHANILALQEEFPVVRILFSIIDWGSEDSSQVSTLILGEYNFETKNYSEEVIKKEEGDFQLDDNQDFVSDNRRNALLTFDSNEEAIENEESLDELTTDTPNQQTFLMDLIDKKINELENNEKYLTTENDELFSLKFEDSSSTLTKYDAQGTETMDEMSLDLTEDIDPLDPEQLLNLEIIDNELFILQSNMESDSNDLEPTIFQVFDLQTGKETAVGKINFDRKGLDASEVFINEIGKNQ